MTQNANKLTAIATIVLAVIGICSALWAIRESDIARIEKHEMLDGHPHLVAENKHTRELLELKISSIEGSIRRIEKALDEVKACMHRMEDADE